MNTNTSRADLHIHSRCSDRPSEWFLRRIGAPESFMEPMEVYRACKEAGMDFVTLSDHNCIRGALEIAHLHDTFISSELTTYFPENGCKIHILVSGIEPDIFPALQEARENIYDLHNYLMKHKIIYSVAHPLYRINDRLTLDQFEQLILMFNRFEGINGSRNPRACDLASLIFKHLTEDDMAQLADKHSIAPHGPKPWNKKLTGGSDDHGGLYTASAYTVTPYASNVSEFLAHLSSGRHEPGGGGGNSIRLANSLYSIAYSYYSSRFLNGSKTDTTVLGAMLRKLSGESPKPPEPPGLRKTIKSAAKKVVMKNKRRQLSDIEQLIVDEFSRVIEEQKKDGPSNRDTEDQLHKDTRNFKVACTISQQLSFTFLSKFAKKLGGGDIIGSLQAVSSMGPILLGIAPYITAFGNQHKDEAFLKSLIDRFPMAGVMRQKTGKRAWFTDTFDDVNGVAHTINTLAGLAADQNRPITVVTCQNTAPQVAYPHNNFNPVGTMPMPEYESQTITFPPFLEILHWIEEEQFDELIISTPGPLGLCGLLAARLFGLTVRGIYHTDFPQFVSSMTEDEALGEMTWKYMRWFYDGMDTIYAPTASYRSLLIENGFDAPAIKILPRGVNLNDFTPQKRKKDFWAGYNLNGGFKFLYVGRVSKEKNLDNMINGFLKLLETKPDADLIIVGDGPYCDELRKRYAQKRIAFTGFLRGGDLQTAYASADAFVFPSMTDTFGNAVLEAHASGLPAIVSNEGGPQEIVKTHNSGLIIDARTPDTFHQAMQNLLDEKSAYGTLKQQALKKAEESRWQIALDLLCDVK